MKISTKISKKGKKGEIVTTRVSTKRVILKKMLKKEMLLVLVERVKKELHEDLDPKNCESIGSLHLVGAVVSTDLLKFGVANEAEGTWTAKKEKKIILFELFSGVGNNACDDEGNMYFLLKVPRRGEFFVRLGEKFEIVRHIPVSVATDIANGLLLDYFFKALKKEQRAHLEG